MRPTVVFPDATAVLVNHLRTELAARGNTAKVGTVVPDPRGVFVYVRRLGGPRLNLVADNAQMTVECWAATAEAAHDLAQLCRAIVNATPGRVIDGVPVYRVDELAGPADLPDPLSDQPRYVFTTYVALRGVLA